MSEWDVKTSTALKGGRGRDEKAIILFTLCSCPLKIYSELFYLAVIIAFRSIHMWLFFLSSTGLISNKIKTGPLSKVSSVTYVQLWNGMDAISRRIFFWPVEKKGAVLLVDLLKSGERERERGGADYFHQQSSKTKIVVVVVDKSHTFYSRATRTHKTFVFFSSKKILFTVPGHKKKK